MGFEAKREAAVLRSKSSVVVVMLVDCNQISVRSKKNQQTFVDGAHTWLLSMRRDGSIVCRSVLWGTVRRSVREQKAGWVENFVDRDLRRCNVCLLVGNVRHVDG